MRSSSTKWENIKWKFRNIRNPLRDRLAAACEKLNLIFKFIFLVKEIPANLSSSRYINVEIRRAMSGSNVWKVSSVKIFFLSH